MSLPAGAPLRPRASWKVRGGQFQANFGRSVGSAGDVNGDGYDDVIVGASDFTADQSDEGRASVYYGSASGLPRIPDWTADGNQLGARLGTSVGTAGDVNGDGYDDVIVGAPDYNNGHVEEGRAFVYYGSASGLSLGPDWTAGSNGGAADFGRSVGTAGDVNGDGYDDVIVGGPAYYNGQLYEGGAFVYYGSASGLSLTPDWTAESNQVRAAFGTSVGTAGDVNGDGYDDVIVGADQYDNGQSDQGRAFVYHGSATGLSTTADWTAESDQAEAHFGGSVGTAGDVNGDGYDDVVVGAEGHLYGQEPVPGRAFVYYGSVSGLSLTADWGAESNQVKALFGGSVGTTRDVNGDGYDDVIVGASRYDNDHTDAGRAFIYYGSAAGPSLGPDWTAESNRAYTNAGYSVGTAGDVNGDGYDDVIVGAPDAQGDEGGAAVFNGRPR